MTSLLEHLENARVDHGLKYNYIQPTDMNAWISTIMSVLLLYLASSCIRCFTRQGADGRNTMNFGKSRAKMFETGDNDTTFKDVAGADEEKAELEEVVDFEESGQI